MIAISAYVETALKNPEYDFQISTNIPTTQEYIDCLNSDFPENAKVIHSPVFFTNDEEKHLFFSFMQKNDKYIYILHPNQRLLKALQVYGLEGNSNICIENFPASAKKPLLTPIDILDYTARRGLSVCFDFAHVEVEKEPMLASFEFLKTYLGYVKVVHFSGNNHTKMSENEWIVWERIVREYPYALRNIDYFVMEHMNMDHKMQDASRLLKLLKELDK